MKQNDKVYVTVLINKKLLPNKEDRCYEKETSKENKMIDAKTANEKSLKGEINSESELLKLVEKEIEYSTKIGKWMASVAVPSDLAHIRKRVIALLVNNGYKVKDIYSAIDKIYYIRINWEQDYNLTE